MQEPAHAWVAPIAGSSFYTMKYAEVIVNVPIRRSFSKRFAETGASEAVEPLDGNQEDNAQLQVFHYHLPPELEECLLPGHLVWVPFGRQEVQGFVIRLTEQAPVATKAIARLARQEPVLTQPQIDVALWMADYYVAPLVETLKIFLPPGLLKREGKGAGVQAKRELMIEWLAPERDLRYALARLRRESPQSRLLEWLLAQPEGAAERERALLAVDVKPVALKGLADKGTVRVENEVVRVELPTAEATARLYEMQRVDKYLPLLDVLLNSSGPIWKSDLYQLVETDLATLRALQKAGLVRLDEKVRFRDPLEGRRYVRTVAPNLTTQQQAVWQAIWSQGFSRWDQPAAKVGKFLLHGVTGSGKNEIYLRAIEEVLSRGRQAVVLVPEIALTPQTVARFAGRFPGRVTVIHSELTAGQRYDVWRRVREGGYDVVVGPRSALFAPLARLGLIIIDEEHEDSYKQDAEAWGGNQVFYDARTVAHQLAERSGSVLISGSATPSLEAYYGVEVGTSTLLSMPRRVTGHQAVSADGGVSVPTLYRELPPVEIVDMRQELRAGHRSILSRSLQAELHATLDAGEQAILFLNRRGSSTFVMCRDCGEVTKCKRCDIPLTYHERMSTLVCHHCNRRYPIPEVCPECQSKRIKYFGTGTQRIEELVQEIEPRARLLRWDADTTTVRGSHEAILARFAAHEADVLVGTQMIAKGLDLPLVTLVGVISADTGLYLPDFRSNERTFQLLTQVAGRAGRSHRGGRVIVQSYTPDHYVVQAAAQHDFEAFYRRELAYRREYRYPPLRRMARLVYWDRNGEKAETAARQMAAVIAHRLQAMGQESQSVDIVGPAPAFFGRLGGYYRWQLILCAADPSAILRPLDIPFGWRIDVDPTSVL
jgi:primosomal protein N' (replication factor Y) (superfamily II helicase)